MSTAACPHATPIGADFDLHAPDFGPNARDILDASREAVRVSRSEQYGGYWVITRHEDARDVAHNPEVFSNCNGVAFPPADFIHTDKMVPITMDPPENTPYRKLLTPLFAPSRVGTRADKVAQIVNYLIDQVIERGKMDLHADISSPLAAVVTLRFLGLNGEDWPKFSKLSHTILERGWISNLPEAEQAEVFGELLPSYQWLFETITARIEQAKALDPAQRGDALIDQIVDAEIDGEPIPMDRLAHIVHNVYEAGLDTNSTAFSEMCIRLGSDTELQLFLRENPDRIADFVEESLRIASPTLFMLRVVKQDVTIGEAEIKAGDSVLISWSAANRDPRAFDNPTTFDIDRSPNRHTVFGLGVHRCLGSHIARLTLNCAVTEFTRRIHELKVNPSQIERGRENGTVMSYKHVPATFTAGPRENSYPEDVLFGPW
jgi:cytochrome P450